jgi:hypothetical protein
MGHGAALIGIYLQMFRDSLSVLSSRVKQFKKKRFVNVLGLLDLRSETSVTTNKLCVTSQKIDDIVGGRLSSLLQL